MFWGVTILGGRRYTQTVERSYHISKAALEISVDSKDQGKKRVQLMLEQNKSHFLLCNLDTDKNIQVDLDLIFTEGEEVTFYLNGQGTVHLTGYVLDFDDVDDYDEDDLDGELSDEESEEEEVTNENDKRILKGGPALNAKKSKVNGLADEDDDEEDDEDDDVLGALDAGLDSDEDEEEDEDDEEDDEEDIPIQQKLKPVQKQVNGQAPKLQQQQQKGTPAKGQQNQQNQKNVASAGKQNNQVGQQNKFGQKGQNSPLGQKPNQNQKGGNQQQQQKGQANQNKQQLNINKAKGPFTPDQKGERKSLPGGLQIDEIHEGHGPEARKGKFVHVRYVGRLANNKEFDRSSNKPFSFRLGAGEVIKGWDLGLQGMKVGGKRKIVVPPNMGYGSRSAGPIPPNSQLHFEVELVSVS